MRRFGWIAVALALSLLASARGAQAEERIALLIGNQGYASEIGALANPHNDIALLEKALKGLRFQVTAVRDAGLAMLHRSVNAYARRVRAAGPGAIAFFYYAGHGAADGGINYLIPVDVKTAEAGELWDRSLRLTEITRRLKAEAGNATHFVVFDACRNNLKLRKAGSRALVQSRGFLPVREESGMLIAYATAEGQLASDGGAGAGPYASVLAEEIVKPGVEAVTMFRAVQLRVREAIGQEPWIGFSALGEVHLAGLPRPAAVPPTQPKLSQAAKAVRICREVERMSNLSLLGVLAGRHKGTAAADCIAARIDQVGRTAADLQRPGPVFKSQQPKGLGYVAVLTSQKTSVDALKRYAELQEKYPHLLGNRTPDIQEVDLSARGKGTFYRVLVGPPGSRAAAMEFCSHLKTAGYPHCWVKGY